VKLQSTTDRKYGMISLLAPFEPPLTAWARHDILDLRKNKIKYGVLAMYGTTIPSRAGLLHEIRSKVHICPEKQVNHAKKYHDLLSQR
jgi:hypothetical protein